MLEIDWIPEICPICGAEMCYNEEEDRDECKACGYEQESNPEPYPDADVLH